MKRTFIYLSVFFFMLSFFSCEKDDPCKDSSLSANFSFDNSINTVGTPLNFADASIGNKNGATYYWDFGDNTTSTLSNPVHSYAATGQYTIKLKVSNSCGISSDATPKTVNINLTKPDQKTLSINRVQQQTKVWCWAACSEMVLNYYQHPTPQCYILSTWFQFDCCTYPNFCQTTGTLQQISTNLNYFGGLKSTIVNSPLTFGQICNEIANDRPMIIAYTNYQAGHVVVIFGYDVTTQKIYVQDPYYYNPNTVDNSYIVPYSTTFSYSGTMQWTNSIYQIGF